MTHTVLSFRLLLEYYKRKIRNTKNPANVYNFCHYARSQSNAAHAQLDEKMRMDFVIEMRRFLAKNLLEFHKIWQKDSSGSI